MSENLRITYVISHPTMHRLLQMAVKTLAKEGITLTVINQMAEVDWATFIKDHIKGVDALYLDLNRSVPMYAELVETAQDMPFVLANGLDLQAEGFVTHPELLKLTQAYWKAASGDNLANMARAMLHAAGKLDEAPAPPSKPMLLGIFWPESDHVWEDTNSFLSWIIENQPQQRHSCIVPVLQDRNSWLNGDTALLDYSSTALRNNDILPMPIFIDFELGNSVGSEAHPLGQILHVVKDRIGAIWNAAVVHGTHSETVPEGGPFGDLHVPVIQLIRNWSDTREEWTASSQGLGGMALTFSLTRPELMGCIDPTLVACTEMRKDSDQFGETRVTQVVPAQIDRLATRTAAWISLRQKPNADKRVVLFLHNPPCKGLEAIIGNAASLDALQSTIDILNRMKNEGYNVEEIPEDGEALLQLILDRKAISEFRWTNIDEIVKKGGVLTQINETTYRKSFDQLPASLQKAINDAWGTFPAKSMVWQAESDDPSLIVTGLQFGNIRVMTDPKRGCYGPKCDGEVCRILHEPDIPPTHHWLATYWYIQDTADAVIHMGTESPLEYLPGKRVGLSEDCFSYLSIGDLPSLYFFVMNSTGEALIAKRRGRAVLIDHLSAPVANSGDVTERWSRLEDLHRQYSQSETAQSTTRHKKLRAALTEELVEIGLCSEDTIDEELDIAIDQLPRRLDILKTRKVEVAKHVLGQAPDEDMRAHYRSELRGTTDRFYDEPAFEAGLDGTGTELDALFASLSGGFVAPGLSGYLSQGKADVVPTGRNVYGVDLKTIPTAAACEVGARIGAKMLNSYLVEEGEFPQTIGITLWSSDAFQSDGELAAQIFWLLGVGVVHDNGGRVCGIRAIPADELTMTNKDGEIIARPRIDVMVQMSSIVRDTLVSVYGWMDKAVQLVSELDEPAEINYLRAHVQTRMDEITKDMPQKADNALKRLATCRIFSTKDGAYSDGLALALDASAWEDDQDLAEIVVNWNSAAFNDSGKEVSDGDKTVAKLLMSQYASMVKRMDISYQKAAPGSDILKYGCYVGTQAGNSVAKRGLGGGKMQLYWGDSQSSAEGDVRSVKEELSLSLAHSILNQEWINFRKGDGYAGASDVSGRVNHLFQWSATTHEVTNAQFDAVHDMLVSNEENRTWLKDTNLYALEEVTRRLLEAEARGLWKASVKRKNELQSAVLELEGDIEDQIGPVTGEFQGSSVDAKTRADVKEWSYDFRVK